MKYYTIERLIRGLERFYYVTNTRQFGENSVRRGGWAFEDTTVGDYVYEVLIADLIIKNENRTWARYIPRIEKAVEAILTHSPEINDLEPDEWLAITEIAQRVKENLPNIQIVPDGKEY